MRIHAAAKTLSTFLSLLLLGAALAGCGGSRAGRHEWRFALEEIQGSVQDAYAQEFRRRIEERSGGDVHVTIYPYGTLGTSAELTELVQQGAVEFAFASPGHLGTVVPEVQVLSLHFVFSDDDTVNHEVLRGDNALFRLLSQAYRRRGLVLLGLVDEGWMVWTGNRPLRRPADFRGFKMRTMTSPLLVEAYRAYGADPTPMPYAEVYSALQLNMVDGQVNPVFAIEEMSFYEVQNTLTFAHHLPFVTTLVSNPAFLDGLPPERQRMVRDVESELDDWAFDTERRLNRERLATIREKGDVQVVRLDEAQRAAFRRASLPVRERYREMAGKSGGAVLDALLAEVRRQEALKRDPAE